MNPWLKQLKYDPVAPLLASENTQIIYFTSRDILEKPAESIETLWDLRIPKQILRKQQSNGSWKYPGKNAWYTTDYDQLETYRELGFLVQMFGFNKSHPAIENAAEYLFSKQSEQGDFRGIYADQYSPNYTAAIAELLIVAGYDSDPRIQRVFDWLLDIRQDDDGWALPLRTKGHNLEVILSQPTIEPDKTKPFSHLITGIVLRAFVAHPKYANSKDAKVAGELLASRFFQKDVYTDLKNPSAWETFSYPFWNTDLISSLHILTELGFEKEHKQLQKALGCLLNKQTPDGLFDLHKNHDRYHDQDLWLALAICRILKTMNTTVSRSQ